MATAAAAAAVVGHSHVPIRIGDDPSYCEKSKVIPRAIVSSHGENRTIS